MKLNIGIVLDIIYITIVSYIFGWVENSTLLSIIKWIALLSIGFSAILMLTSTLFFIKALRDYKVRQKINTIENTAKKHKVAIRIVLELALASVLLLPEQSNLGLSSLAIALITKNLIHLSFLFVVFKLRKKMGK